MRRLPLSNASFGLLTEQSAHLDGLRIERSGRLAVLQTRRALHSSHNRDLDEQTFDLVVSSEHFIDDRHRGDYEPTDCHCPTHLPGF